MLARASTGVTSTLWNAGREPCRIYTGGKSFCEIPVVLVSGTKPTLYAAAWKLFLRYARADRHDTLCTAHTSTWLDVLRT